MDNSCMLFADEMSCEAQSQLAQAEVYRNNSLNNYMLAHPACDRFNGLMDREEEYNLLKTVGSNKKLCVNKRPSFSDGPWKQQFNLLLGDAPKPNATNVVYTKYDQWTRAKNATKRT